MKFFPARWFKRHTEPRAVERIVIHTTESSEKPGIAERIAVWSANGHGGRQASAHFYIDNTEIVQSVAENDIAWHAAGDNAKTIGIELCGSARQNSTEWADPFSQAVLAKAAALVAWLTAKYGIPVVRLTADDIKAGREGICGHTDVSKAFGKSTHWDPGPSFPWGDLLSRVKMIRLQASPHDPVPAKKPATAPLAVALKAIAALIEQIKKDPVKKGDKGDKVVLVQKLLRQHGLSITVDGDFGNQTEVAVRTFQMTNRLTADGVVGPKTIDRLVAR